MNEEMMQGDTVDMKEEEMSPEDAKATLGLSTRLSEQFLIPQASIEGEEGTETEEPEEDAEEDEKPDMKEEFDSMKEELEAMIEEKVGGIREDIKEALQNTDEENEN